MRISRRVRQHPVLVALGAVVAAGAIGLTVAGGSAFTDSNGFTNTNVNVGYGVQSVSGATVISVVYTLGSGGATITGVTFETSGDTHNSTGSVGFTTSGGAGTLTACAAGSYTSGSPGYTTYDCTGLSQATSGVLGTDIALD